jgi:hypothetical protein
MVPTLRDHAGDEDGDEGPLPSLDARDGVVIDIIRKERLSQFSFDGLRRRSGLHQETLSRILDRLEGEGLLSKSSQGYSVTGPFEPGVEMSGDPHLASIPLLQTLLPDDVELSQVTAALRGRWFGRLRWLGMSQEGETALLKWISEDAGIQVDAAFSPGQLEVTAIIKEGWKLTDAVKASYELMGHLTRFYARLNPRRRIALLDLRNDRYLPN